jgi:hypothetical protein
MTRPGCRSLALLDTERANTDLRHLARPFRTQKRYRATGVHVHKKIVSSLHQQPPRENVPSDGKHMLLSGFCQSAEILVTTDLYSISTIPTTSDDEPAARRNRPYDYSPYDDEDSVFQESIPKTETSQVDSSRIQYTPLINDTTLPVHPQYESLSRFPAVHQPSSAEVPQPRVSTPATLVNQRQSSTNEHGYASTMQSRYSPSQPPQVVSNHFTPITVPEAVADVPRDSQDGGRRILGTVELDARDTHDIFKQ